ncbi:EF-hand domain-containing protein [Stieleria mannarensis]|uniref:EF-hand domain-containing protein n=1 Tax=Stieleria mannarensis TaxID=2755585 RepID=UPI0025701626|nr:EF-hand domain-containing protein [Rhodopirellula sp. JC639]
MIRRSVQCAVFSGIILVPGLLFAQPPGRGGQQGGMRGGPPTEMIFQLFQQADSNGDGSVTRAELTTAMQTMARGDRRGRGGPPPQGMQPGIGQPQPLLGAGGPPPRAGGEGEPGGHPGPPPQPGQVLPEPIAASLNLTDRQSRQLAALQADVDKRLAAILTDEQEAQLQQAGPAHGQALGPGPGEGQLGERRGGRPERPL